jgi:non-heme chloroperoxidase
MAAAGAPVVFVHGMFLHATSWGAWVELFQAAGYAPGGAGLVG